MATAENTVPHVPERVVDDRRPSHGLGRLVMLLYWLFGAALTLRALMDLYAREEEPIGPLLVSLLAGLVALVAAAALTHNGRRMRMIGWVCVSVTAAGPLILGLAGWGVDGLDGARSPWLDFGAAWFFLPPLVGVVGMVWMWWSNPRRIVELAEQVERAGRARRR